MTAPTCPKCGDTGSLSGKFYGALDCTACDVAESRFTLRAWVSMRTDCFDEDSLAWACYLRGRADAAPLPEATKPISTDSILVRFQLWANLNLGQAYSLESEEGIYTDKVTRWCFNGFKAGYRFMELDARDAARWRKHLSMMVENGHATAEICKTIDAVDAAIATGEPIERKEHDPD